MTIEPSKFDETPQEAAERIWKAAHGDPIETMKRFGEWARERPERILAVIGKAGWDRAVRRWRPNAQ